MVPPYAKPRASVAEVRQLEQRWDHACTLFLNACFKFSPAADVRILGADVMAARARLDRALGET
jgi:hypothetical protein